MRLMEILQLIYEDIDASEAYTDDGALQTVIDGKRDLAYVNFDESELQSKISGTDLKIYKPFPEGSELRKKYIGYLTRGWPTKSAERFADTAFIVYRDNKNGNYSLKAFMRILQQTGGFVSDDTPYITAKIGKLLGYSKQSISNYLKKNIANGTYNKIKT